MLSSVSLHSFLGIAARMAVGMGLTSPFDSLLPRKTMGGFGISNAVLPICCQNGQKGLRWVGSAAAKRRFGQSRDVDPETKNAAGKDRKSVVSGTSVSVRVDLGGRRIIK